MAKGGSDLGYIVTGDYAKFSNVNFGSGAATFQARIAGTSTTGKIYVRLDSPTGTDVGVLNGVNTGDWQTYTTAQCSVSGVSGTHDLYLVFDAGLNINWFKFLGNTNLVLNQTAAVSNYYQNNATYNGAKALAGDGASRWATDDGTTSCLLEVALPSNTAFSKTVIKQYGSTTRINSYQIQYWNGSSWVNAYSGSNPALTQTDTFTTVTGNKVRLNIESVNGTLGPTIYEFDVYNNYRFFKIYYEMIEE